MVRCPRCGGKLFTARPAQSAGVRYAECLSCAYPLDHAQAWAWLGARQRDAVAIFRWDQFQGPAHARRVASIHTLEDLLGDPQTRDLLFPLCETQDGMIFSIVGDHYFVWFGTNSVAEETLEAVVRGLSL